MLRPVAVLLRQHWRRLRAQPVRTALAVLAVAAGTALGMGVVIVVSSATSSLDALGQAVAGPAPLRVVGAVADGGIPDRLVGQVRRVPQVAGVLPVVQVASVVRTADGGHLGVVVLGVGCGPSEPTATGPCPAGTTAPAVGGALAAQLGPASWLQTDQGVLPLGSVSVRPALASVAGGRVVVLGLADAQRLYDEQRRVDVVYVALRAGASVPAVQQQLERRVGPAFAVLTADQPPPALTLATSSFVPLLALVAVLAAGIAAVLVYDVVALSLEEHRREQAVLAAVGAAPGVVAAGPLLDVGLLGLLGGLLGVAGGAAVARPILAPLSAFTEAIFGVPLAVHVDPTDVLLGVGFGLAVGLAAVVRPTRRLATMDVAGELAGRARRVEASAATVGRRGLVAAGALGVGLVLVFVGSRHGALAGWQLPVAEVGFLLAVAAGAGVVGAGAALALRCARARPRRRRFRAQGRSGRLPPALSLGVVSLGREPGRVAVIAVAVAAAVAVGTVTSGYTAGLAAQVSTSVRASAAGRGVVVDTVAGTSGDNPGAHVPAAAVREIARVPGVGQVDEDVSVLSGSSPASLVLVTAAASPAGGPALVAGRATVGPFRRGAVLVGTGLARARGLRPGGRLALDTPGGRVRVPVEGIWNDGAVNGDNVTMDAAELERLFGPQLPLSLTVVPAPGTTTAELLARLRTLPLPPDVTLAAPTSYRHQQVAQLTGQLSPFDTLEQALLVVAFVGVLATLLLMAAGQRRQMALGQAIGLTPADVAATVVAGAVAAAGAGAAGGVVLGAVVLRGLLWLVPLVVGVTVPYRFPLAVLVTLAPLAVAVAGAAAALPAVQAVRAPVVDELRRD